METTPIRNVNYNDNPVEIVSDGGETSDRYKVIVVDYDGTVLKEDELTEGKKFILPDPPPNHPNLIFEGWSSPIDIVDNTITVEDQDIVIGPMYHTTSGKNEFDIELTKVTGLEVILYIPNATIEWGDGATETSSTTNITHTYTNYGKYTIMISGITSLNSTIFYQGVSRKNYFVTEARLSNNVTTLSNSVFSYCISLKSIAMSNSITSIGQFVFRDCASLKVLILSNNVSTLNLQGSIAYCDSLLYVIIPNGISAIPLDTFSYNKSLQLINLPNSVTSIGSLAFSSCNSLKRINLSNITNLSSSCFRTCPNLNSKISLSSATSIEANAFYNCPITEVEFSNNLLSIGTSAFSSCTLRDIILPNSVTNLANSVFSNCYSLSSIILSNNLTDIPLSLLSGCSSLKSIKIPNGVTTIGASAFYSCYSCTKYDFSNCTQVPILDNINAFQNINAIAKIIVPDALYDEWIQATNWVTYVDYIYKVSEINNETYAPDNNENDSNLPGDTTGPGKEGNVEWPW